MSTFPREALAKEYLLCSNEAKTRCASQEIIDIIGEPGTQWLAVLWSLELPSGGEGVRKSLRPRLQEPSISVSPNRCSLRHLQILSPSNCQLRVLPSKSVLEYRDIVT